MLGEAGVIPAQSRCGVSYQGQVRMPACVLVTTTLRVKGRDDRHGESLHFRLPRSSSELHGEPKAYSDPLPSSAQARTVLAGRYAPCILF